MAMRDYLIGEVAEDFTDGLVTRREAIRRLGLLGLGLAGASTLLAACTSDEGSGSSVSGGTSTPPAPPAGSAAPAGPAGTGGKAELVDFGPSTDRLKGAWAAPDNAKAALLVIHENRGLTPHFEELVVRFAGQGYAALAPDLVTGGTAGKDEAQVQGALGADSADVLQRRLVSTIDELQRRVPGKKVGAVGFCFGGGLGWSLVQSGEPRLAAVAPFYGPGPANPDFSRSKAAVLGVYAENDTRVNATRESNQAALQRAGLTHEIRTFAGADHAFFNDTGARYNPTAAAEAQRALLDWFGRHLA
ncbi:MAG: Dienelactone hydrolase family protein [uncultured Acidimicrobiales bacterium]|uniref:Dienelactone hydrolase family protein n=1 Tax=uncultured Acidimicrobiales bacterium TaxID=310071 RepID=A0A6J4IQI8_9ACTN|nr:MAG: Dienelactone hydrolase family protein [uncultured Acidimicrobiales bacterium]